MKHWHRKYALYAASIVAWSLIATGENAWYELPAIVLVLVTTALVDLRTDHQTVTGG